MFIDFLFIAFTAAIVYNLVRSTEKTLARRPVPVKKDVRIIDHRSRM